MLGKRIIDPKLMQVMQALEEDPKSLELSKYLKRKLQFDSVDGFSEGLAVASRNGNYGFIDKFGKTIIGFKFDNAQAFTNGQAIVTKNSIHYFVDKTGKVLVKIEQQDRVWPFCDGMAVICQNNRYGFINQKGEVIVEPQYDDALSFYNGLARVMLNGKVGMVNKVGQLVIEIKYDSIEACFKDRIATAVLNGQIVFLDIKGEFGPRGGAIAYGYQPES